MDLYRGKNNQGNWVYGGVNENKTCIIFKFQFIPVTLNTVTQNIGVRDSEGNWIYEGDIVKIKSVEIIGKDSRELVYWDKIKLSFCTKRFLDGFVDYCFPVYLNNCVIVGNIFDNPELLKGCGYEWEPESR